MRFGQCLNKLKLLLDLGAVAFKLSFVFQADGSFSERLKEDVLIKAGERKALALMEKENIDLPLSLASQEHLPIGKTNILDAILIFSKALLQEDLNYRQVWDKHMVGPENLAAQEASFVFHFSKKMASLLAEDLKTKLEDLDFDKDPYQTVGSLIEALQEFDSISKRNTLSILRPKLEAWLQLKLGNIREVVGRALIFENWQPISEVSI